jgi:hypothetical protein
LRPLFFLRYEKNIFCPKIDPCQQQIPSGNLTNSFGNLEGFPRISWFPQKTAPYYLIGMGDILKSAFLRAKAAEYLQRFIGLPYFGAGTIP